MAAEGIMAARESSVKSYVVRLSAEDRERLEALNRKGKSPAQRLLKARILLKADVSEAGEGWSDSRIIKALETSVSVVGEDVVGLVHFSCGVCAIIPVQHTYSGRIEGPRRV